MPATTQLGEPAGGSAAPAGGRAALLLFVAALVVLAFGRAYFASSTGIQISGDGADYARIAEAGELQGRAPFVYRPLVPLLVGAASPGNTTLGFALLCAVAMFAALYGSAAAAGDRLVGFGLAAILLLDYQVLFSAANPARLDVIVLAAQVGFVQLALRRAEASFFLLLPACALLKESMLLGLAPLALAAFPRDRAMLLKLAGSGLAFVGLHVAVRAAARPTAFMPPYTEDGPSLDGMREMLAGNLSILTPLDLFLAFGGLALIAGYLALRGDRATPDPLLFAVTPLLLAFPLPLATDVHRAWFELLAPTVLFFVMRRAARRDGARLRPALAAALLAGIIPYATRLVAPDHLYLLILEDRLTPAAIVALVAALVGAATAAWMWPTANHPHR